MPRWVWLVLIACVLAMGGGLPAVPRVARAAGEGFFSLDKAAYEIQEGTAVPVTIVRSNGTTLEQDVTVTVQLSEGIVNEDYPSATITQNAVFPKGTATNAVTLYFQTINRQRMIDRLVRVTITQVTVPNAIAYPSTAPLLIIGIGSPYINDVVPKSANPGDWITIRGRNFSNHGVWCPPIYNATAVPGKAQLPMQVVGNTVSTFNYDPVDSGNAPIPPAPPRCTVMVEYYLQGSGLGPPTGYPGTIEAARSTDLQVIDPNTLQARVPDLASVCPWHSNRCLWDVRVTIRDPAAPPPAANGVPAGPYPGTHYLSTSSVVTADQLYVTGGPPPATDGPTINAVIGNSGSVAGGSGVQINGTRFNKGPALGSTGQFMCDDQVFFGGQLASAADCTWINSTQIKLKTPAHSAGTVDVILARNGQPFTALPPLTSPVTPETKFTYTGGPTILSITPSTGPSAGGTTVTITGTGFSAPAPGCGGGAQSILVLFGTNQPTSCTVTNDTQIIAVSPPGVGVQQITIAHPQNGTSAFTTAANFTYVSGPVISSLSPDSGPPGGGTVVTIAGANFADGATVTFGGVDATFIYFDGPAQIRAVSPPGGGMVDVVVTVAGVSSPTGAPTKFSYSLPGITELKPNAGAVAGGNTVLVTGFNFVAGATVAFGGNVTPAADVEFVDSTKLKVKVPKAAAPSVVDVRVTTPSGMSSVVQGVTAYTYTDGPIVTGLNPTSGKTAGGDIVVITGVNFGKATTPLPGVTVGGIVAPAINRNSETQITILTPANSTPGDVDILVSTAQGTSPVSPDAKFKYLSTAPVITAISPDRAPTYGGTTVTISGSGFSGTQCPAGVTFGLAKAASCTVSNDTTIVAVAPPNTAGPTVVLVTTPNGQTEIAVNFTYYSGSGAPPETGGGPAPVPVPPPSGQAISYTLGAGWTLITWMGPEGIAVANMLKQTPGPGVDLTAKIAVIYTWDPVAKLWRIYFTGSDGGPVRASDFTTLKRGQAYWFLVIGKDPVVLGTVDG